MGLKLKVKNGGSVWTDKTDVSLDVGDTPSVAGLSAKTDGGPGGFYRTTIKLDNVAQTVVNGTEHQGTKIYDFPEGRINILGGVATLQQKTTSAVASTLNASSTGAIALGTTTSASTTLNGTAADVLASTAFTSSATVNVAGTAVTGLLTAAVFDGTGTAKDLYVNTAYATTGDVDADATQTISGTIVICWVNMGDK